MSEGYYQRSVVYRGHNIEVSLHYDEDTGPPWEVHDGHGVVSDWVTRDKRPGEWTLCEDRYNRRFYDAFATQKIALRDGWGCKDGRHPKETPRQYAARAVKEDFDYLRRWCHDEWHWIGYTTQIKSPSGLNRVGDSCWGFDDESDAVVEAIDAAKTDVDRFIETEQQTQIAEAYP